MTIELHHIFGQRTMLPKLSKLEYTPEQISELIALLNKTPFDIFETVLNLEEIVSSKEHKSNVISIEESIQGPWMFTPEERNFFVYAANKLADYLCEVPDNPIALMGQGLFFSCSLDYGFAMIAYNFALQDMPDIPQIRASIYNRIGNAYFGLLEYGEGVKNHKMAINTDPTNPVYYLPLATHFRLKGEYELALSFVNNALSQYPDFPPAKRIKDTILLEMK